MAIWGRYNGGQAERVDSGSGAYLLYEYRLAFGRGWVLWKGRKRDEPICRACGATLAAPKPCDAPR